MHSRRVAFFKNVTPFRVSEWNQHYAMKVAALNVSRFMTVIISPAFIVSRRISRCKLRLFRHWTSTRYFGFRSKNQCQGTVGSIVSFHRAKASAVLHECNNYSKVEHWYSSSTKIYKSLNAHVCRTAIYFSSRVPLHLSSILTYFQVLLQRVKWFFQFLFRKKLNTRSIQGLN